MGLLSWCELQRERSMDVAVTDVAYQRPVRRWKPERCDRIALVLQGGGAPGAYQAGVFQALSEADIEPDWVTGVSIGAINSAIIAGNSKQWRLKRLRTFWERITERKIWSYTPDGDVFRKARNAASSWLTLIQGQPGFFSPRHPTRGSALPELKVPGAIMTTRRCVRRSKTWSISRCSTKRQCAFRWAR